MASAKERLSILENVIARVGIENALKEYSKAMSSLNGFQTIQEMTPPMPEFTPIQNAGGTISGQPMQSPVQTPMMGNSNLP